MSVRPRGRPRLPDRPKPSVRPVKLAPIIDDALCSWAIRHRVSVHAAMIYAIKKLVLFPVDEKKDNGPARV